MAISRGKQFEGKFRDDFKKLTGSFIYRLPDQTSGNLGSRNLCDFICYVYPNLYILEVKSVGGNTFPITNFTQYQTMLQYKGAPGVKMGVVIWYTEKDTVIYVPLKTIEKMKQDGKKSVNIRTIDAEEYEYITIPSVKKRVFLDSDYSVLLDLPEGW